MQNYKLISFVPEDAVESVKNTIFATGAGGEIMSSAHGVTLETGLFLPLNGSNPAIGEVDCVEQISEWRVEILCSG